MKIQLSPLLSNSRKRQYHPFEQLRAAFIALLGISSASLFSQRAEDNPLPPQPLVQASFKFDFGSGTLRDGYERVAAGHRYSAERGSGFDFDSNGIDLEAGVTTDEEPFFFSVAVPEGNYRITATLQGAVNGSSTTIRTESGHLMAVDVIAKPGETVSATFVANVRRPELPAPPRNAPGGSKVHMFLAGEPEARCWDDRLTIEFNGVRPLLQSLEIVKDDTIPTLFMAGDSTVGDPRRGPGGNWPTQICQFFKPEIAVCNSAEGGETSKSFITGYRFDKVLSQMKAGDYFLVQFGHNDSKPQWPQSYTEPATSFKAYLGVFIAETRRRGATLVLVSPMERRQNRESVGPWARAMREVASEQNVPFIDQWTMSKQLWTAMGPDVVGQAFNDQTHLSGYGGYLLSRVVAKGITEHVPELARFLVDDLELIDLESPPTPPEYLQQSPGSGHVKRR